MYNHLAIIVCIVSEKGQSTLSVYVSKMTFPGHTCAFYVDLFLLHLFEVKCSIYVH